MRWKLGCIPVDILHNRLSLKKLTFNISQAANINDSKNIIEQLERLGL